MKYDAFISYSHDTDQAVTEGIQAGLQRFAKPWHRRQALSVFRDSTGLSANPALWSSITAAMDESEHLVVLCSPDTAESPWVGREIDYWCQTKPAGRILPVLTAGELVWNDTAHRFDPEASTAAHPALTAAFAEEPLYSDFRFARTDDQMSLRDPRFRDAIAGLAAPMHGVAKDQLIGEDIRQHRRTLRVAWAAAIALLILTIASVAGATIAVRERNRADHALTQLRAANGNLETVRGKIRDQEQRLAKAQALTREAVRGRSDAIGERDSALIDKGVALIDKDVAVKDAYLQKGLAAVAARARDQANADAQTAQSDADAARVAQQQAEELRLLAVNDKNQALNDKNQALDDAAAAGHEVNSQTAVARATRLANAATAAAADGQQDLGLLLAKASADVRPVGGEQWTTAPATRDALTSNVLAAKKDLLGYLHIPGQTGRQQLGLVSASPSGSFVAAVETSDAIQDDDQNKYFAHLYVWRDAADPSHARLTTIGADLHCVTDLQWTSVDIFVTVEAPMGCLNRPTVGTIETVNLEHTRIRAWYAPTGEEFTHALALDRYPGIAPTFTSPVQVSADHRYLAVSLDYSKLTPVGAITAEFVYDMESLATGTPHLDVLFTKPVDFSFSPSGKLASGWDADAGRVAVWDLRRWDAAPDCVLKVQLVGGCFHEAVAANADLFIGTTFGPPGPDGSEEVFAANANSTAANGYSDTARVFDSATGALVLEHHIAAGITGMAFFGDTMVFTDGASNVHHFDWRADGPEGVFPVSGTAGCNGTVLDRPTVGTDRLLFIDRSCQEVRGTGTLTRNAVIVVDLNNGQTLRELRGALAYAGPGDRYVVSEQLEIVGSTAHWSFELWDFSSSQLAGGGLVANRTDARAAVSPDGTVLVSYKPYLPGSDTSDAELWHLDSTEISGAEHLSGSQGTETVAFSGAHTLIGAGHLGSVATWDPSLHPYDTLFSDAPNDLLRSVVSADGTTRAVSRDARSVSLVPLGPGASRELPDLGLAAGEQIDWMFFSVDGNALVVNTQLADGGLTGSVVVSLTGAPSAHRYAEFGASTNGSVGSSAILFETPDRLTVTIRDSTSLTATAVFRADALGPDPGLPGSPGNLFVLDSAVSRVAGTNSSGKVVVWSLDGRVLNTFSPHVTVTGKFSSIGVRFSPDLRHLAAMFVDKQLRVYDLTEGDGQQPLIKPMGVGALLRSKSRIVYDPSGELIAVDGVFLLNAATLDRIGPQLKPSSWNRPQDQGTQAMRFVVEPGGAEYLVEERVGDTDAVRWRVDLGFLAGEACRLAGRSFTAAESRLYLGTNSDATTCPEPRPRP